MRIAGHPNSAERLERATKMMHGREIVLSTPAESAGQIPNPEVIEIFGTADAAPRLLPAGRFHGDAISKEFFR